ncbi:chromosomal replication initiator protein DnaA [Candidatus Microgenomates bacterium]|nr:chromosomal replication initiator protein DnaA [Candidatus Microgenomates bacterium]
MGNEILWKQALDVVKVSVSGAQFSTWFGQTQITNIKNGSEKRQTIEIGCPSLYIRDQLEKRYFGTIQDALNQITGKSNDLTFAIHSGVVVSNNSSKPSPLFEQNEDENKFEVALAKSKLPSAFNFDNFAVSGSNQMAWAAAQAVSKEPGHAYNPLFIWGGVGVGKTHLSIATAREVIKDFPNKKVLFCTSDEFTVGIVDAIRTKTSNEFRNKFRNVDVLIIDDIQFIAGRLSVQEEFFNTFNAIIKAGNQIILTSDRPPNEIQKLPPRLRDRFEAGLIVDIGKADFELICAIVTIKTRERKMGITTNSIQKIATSFPSARSAEGFLIKLQYQAALSGTSVNEELVDKLLGKRGGGARFSDNRNISHQDILEAVSVYFSISKKSLLFGGRSKTIVVPRQILMYLLRIELKLNLVEIGRILGGRDHTTVMHGVDKISTSLAQNQQISGDIMRIKQEVWG